MKSYEIMTSGTEETQALAKQLGQRLNKNDIILLEGDLGAGKTTFTKGLAIGLDIQENVNSPTFTMIKEYRGRLPLYHMDVYRVENEFEDLGFDEYFYGDGVTVIEWAHLIEEQLPEQFLEIKLLYESAEQRKIIFKPNGLRYERLCKELFNENIRD